MKYKISKFTYILIAVCLYLLYSAFTLANAHVEMQNLCIEITETESNFASTDLNTNILSISNRDENMYLRSICFGSEGTILLKYNIIRLLLGVVILLTILSFKLDNLKK